MLTQATERITADFERRILEMQTVLDKLLFLTSLQAWLGAQHRQLFDQWLSSPLEEQYNMLAPHYHAAAESGALSADAFALSPFAKFIPAGGVEEGPRVLFYSNLDLTLRILQEEFPVEAPRAASPAQSQHIASGLPQFLSVHEATSASAKSVDRHVPRDLTGQPCPAQHTA